MRDACCSWRQLIQSATRHSFGGRREQLGIPESAAETVEAEGLLELGCPSGFPSSTGSLGCLSGSRAEGAPRRPPSPGGSNRSGDRSGSPRLAPGAGGIHARRGRCRRARAFRWTGAGARRIRGRRCVPRARRRAHARAHAPRAAPARGRRREARCRRSGGCARAVSRRRGRSARRARARPGRPLASPDRVGAAARRRRRPPVSERGEPP